MRNSTRDGTTGSSEPQETASAGPEAAWVPACVRVFAASAARMILAATLALGGCGSGASDDTGQVLFEGPAAALLPHEVGLTRRFSVRAERGNDVRSSTVTRRVVASEPPSPTGAPFVIETLDATGVVKQRDTYQDHGSEILVTEIHFAPATPGAHVVTLPPDTVRYRTPVVAGEEVRAPFALTLDLDVDVAGRRISSTVVFDASVVRTARGIASIEGSDGQAHQAIRFSTATTGSARLAIAGVALQLALDSRGEELVVPGTGQVAAAEEVTVRFSVDGETDEGEGRATVRIETRALDHP